MVDFEFSWAKVGERNLKSTARSRRRLVKEEDWDRRVEEVPGRRAEKAGDEVEARRRTEIHQTGWVRVPWHLKIKVSEPIPRFETDVAKRTDRSTRGEASANGELSRLRSEVH